MLTGCGTIVLGGPIASDDEEDIALLAVEASDEHVVRSISHADPWAVNQVFWIKRVRAWTLGLDERSRSTANVPPSPGPAPSLTAADTSRTKPPF